MKLYLWVNYWLDYWWDYHITRFRLKRGYQVMFYRKVSKQNKVDRSIIVDGFRKEAAEYEHRYDVELVQASKLESGHVEDDFIKNLVTFRMIFKRI